MASQAAMSRDETIKALRFAESAIALKPTVPVDFEALRAALHYLTAQARVIEKLKAEFDRHGYYDFDGDGAHTLLRDLLAEEGLS